MQGTRTEIREIQAPTRIFSKQNAERRMPVITPQRGNDDSCIIPVVEKVVNGQMEQIASSWPALEHGPA